MEVLEIKSFDKLLEAFESQNTGQNFIYRGVSDSKFQLITSLGRCESALGKPISRLETRLTKLFKESSIPYLEHRPNNELEWLAVAQHYGLPTRLLDWSYNPLVSTYFSVKVYKYRPPYISARIQNQSGLFTVHNTPDLPFEDDNIKKIIIPKELKAGIKKKLFKYGINQRLIYPGLEGVAKDLRWLETVTY